MTISLGLDIGSNSVGSAWVDTEKQEVHLGVSVFPAGVDEQESKRGAPNNQARREKRSQRRSLARRAARKRRIRVVLTEAGLLPRDPAELNTLFEVNPWYLRHEALSRPLSPYEFGRVLVHLCQHRGAIGIETDPDDADEGKVKEGIDRLAKLMNERRAETAGQLLAELMDERKQAHPATGKTWNEPIRNRQYRMKETNQLYADRRMVRDEFIKLWDRQESFDSPLSALLADTLKTALDEPTADSTWRHKGSLFGQRQTYWNTGTLGRCDLEPTERCAPMADMHAQAFRVIETANNIRITKRGEPERALTPDERERVLSALRKQKTGSVATVRKALGIDKKAVKEFYTLNIERDAGREINTDWFYREIVHGVFTEERWREMTLPQRESVNRAVLKFDALREEHREHLRRGARQWWALSTAQIDRLVGLETWWQWNPKDDDERKLRAEQRPALATRPKLESRVKLSRRAIRNLLPYMNEPVPTNGHWRTEIAARRRIAEDGDALDQTTGQPISEQQCRRYALGARPLTSADRHYLRKHEDPFPPAPMLSNPVVRKAIHEVRRHLIAWWRKFGRAPDRIVIEYVRSATQPEKVRNEALSRNRKREAVRKRITEQFELSALSRTQQMRAIERILLCRQQKGMCPYCGEENPITERIAAEGRSVESDHIVPLSRSQNNGLNNKVLCHRHCNRGKGNQTPKEWLHAGSAAFQRLEQRLQHLEKGDSPDDYFTGKDCARKWENLHRDAPSTGDFLNSQFTDTAYAAKQVGQWLREVLYDGERDGGRRVFTTKGSYTSILRNDWGLSESDLDRQWHNIAEPGDTDGDNQSRRARKEKNKDRSDHLHHAIDAISIAFAPDRLQDLARYAEERERAHAESGDWPKRRALRPPWPAIPDNATDEQLSSATAEFRRQVLAVAGGLVVSHRAVKRRIVGAFHEETAYGPVVAPLPPHRRENPSTLFTNRIQAAGLTANHLRVPEGWDELSDRLDDQGLSVAQKRDTRKALAAMADPSPGKSGIVRDRALRDQIRKCLRRNGLDPNAFSKDDIKRLTSGGGLTMKSGTPIKSAILLRTNTDPVVIPRKRWNSTTNQMVPDPDPRTARVYIGGNNHHIEIRENPKTGRWSGQIVTGFEAARRNARRLQAMRDAGVPDPKALRRMNRKERSQFRGLVADIDRRCSVVDRADNEMGKFVMSLAEGETLYMRHPDTAEPGYFVVFKLDKPNTIHFIHHWDARASKTRKDENGTEIPMSQREDIALVATNLKALGVETGKPPCKVRVGPLGTVAPMLGD